MTHRLAPLLYAIDTLCIGSSWLFSSSTVIISTMTVSLWFICFLACILHFFPAFTDSEYVLPNVAEVGGSASRLAVEVPLAPTFDVVDFDARFQRSNMRRRVEEDEDPFDAMAKRRMTSAFKSASAIRK